MKRSEALNAMMSVTAGFTSVTCISEDGEMIFKRGFPTGEHKLVGLAHSMAESDSLEFGPDCDVYILQSRARRVPYGVGATDSGANPDFQVTSATRNAREMERTLSLLNLKIDTLDRRSASLAAMEKRKEKAIEKNLITNPQKPDPVQLIDEGDTSPEPSIETPSEGSSSAPKVAVL